MNSQPVAPHEPMTIDECLEAGDWQRHEYTGESGFPIPCLDINLTLDQIYEGLD